MNYGLPDEVFAQMSGVLKQYPVHQAILFGSRAKQTHRPGSDIDLAIVGVDLTWNDLLDIQQQLTALGFLYTFDVQDLTRIKNPELLEHIHRVGKVIYENNSCSR